MSKGRASKGKKIVRALVELGANAVTIAAEMRKIGAYLSDADWLDAWRAGLEVMLSETRDHIRRDDGASARHLRFLQRHQRWVERMIEAADAFKTMPDPEARALYWDEQLKVISQEALEEMSEMSDEFGPEAAAYNVVKLRPRR